MDGMERRLIETLEELVEIPSPTGQEGVFQRHLCARLESLGFTCSLQEISPGRPNLIATRGRTPLLLCTHADTVPAPGYRLLREGESLRGRGVLDAKGQIAALLWALEASEAPAAVAITVDEEEKGLGSEMLTPPDWLSMAVVLEPTGLDIAVAEAGAVEVEITVRGREAHAACPEGGDNAIYKAFRLLRALREIPALKVQHPLLGRPRITPYWMESGARDCYLVPGEAKLRLDIAVFPPCTPEEVRGDVENVVASFGNLTVLDADAPFETSPDARVVRLLSAACEKALGMKPALCGMPSWTDAEPLHRKGLETVVFGAGELASAHTGDEKLEVGELVRLALVLKELIALAAD